MRSAASECLMGRLLPRHVKPFGVIDNRRVTGSGWVPHRDPFAFPDRVSTNFGVALGYASEVDDRGYPAQHLFDGVRDSVRIVDELLTLAAVLDQCAHATGRRVSCGVVPGEHQDAEEEGHLGLA